MGVSCGLDEAEVFQSLIELEISEARGSFLRLEALLALGWFCQFVMIIFSLNARGLGRPEKRLAIRKLVRKHKVDYLMLQETKVGSDIHMFAREVWGNDRCAWSCSPSTRASFGGGAL